MFRSLIVLMAGAMVLASGSRDFALAQMVSLGPPVARAEAALTVKAEIGPAQAVERADTAGRPAFGPAARAAFFVAVDVRAARGNKNGFGTNEFIPYLTIAYVLTPRAGGAAVQGELHQLVTPQGLRYGNNVKAPDTGPYTLTLTIEPPIKVGFGRHTDIETGVARWWRPFQMEWVVDATRVAKP